ncbi:hypothetical protein ACYCVF_29645 [Bradyrhizobium sp. 1.29L]
MTPKQKRQHDRPRDQSPTLPPGEMLDPDFDDLHEANAEWSAWRWPVPGVQGTPGSEAGTQSRSERTMTRENDIQPDPPPADDEKPAPRTKHQPTDLPEVPCQGFSIGEM